MTWSRLLLIFFSMTLHGAAATVLYLFSGSDAASEERVYHVSLAEFAAPPPALAESVQAAAPPEPEPEPEPVPPPAPEPEPEPAPDPPKEPEVKAISTKKKPDAPPKEKPKPRKADPKPTPPAQAEGPPGPRPSQIGGLSAYKSDHVDQRPSIARRVAPEYPNKAKRMNIEGKVLVQLVVDTSGAPKACTVKSADPPGYFEDAALAAAGKMRFIPGKLKGQVVNTVVLLPFAFRLH